jgi:hypothetical protein
MDLEIVDLYISMPVYTTRITVSQKDTIIVIKTYYRRYNGDYKYIDHYLIDKDVGKIIFMRDDIQKLK